MRTEHVCMLALIFLQFVVWMPYVLNMVSRIGLFNAIGYDYHESPYARWAERMKKAHYNMVENHFIFFGLVFLLHVSNGFTDDTALASVIYVAARVVHLMAYTLAIPFGARTLSFAVALVAKVSIAIHLLGAIS